MLARINHMLLLSLQVKYVSEIFQKAATLKCLVLFKQSRSMVGSAGYGFQKAMIAS